MCRNNHGSQCDNNPRPHFRLRGLPPPDAQMIYPTYTPLHTPTPPPTKKNKKKNMYKQHPTPNTTASRRNRVSQHDVFVPTRGGKFLTNMRQHAPFIVTTYQGRSDLEYCIIATSSPMIVCKIHVFFTSRAEKYDDDDRNARKRAANEREEKKRMDYLSSRYMACKTLESSIVEGMTVREYIESQGMTYDEEFDEARPVVKADGLNIYLELYGCLENIPLSQIDMSQVLLTMRKMAAWGPCIFDRRERSKCATNINEHQLRENWYEDYNPMSYPPIYPKCGIGHTYIDPSRRPELLHTHCITPEESDRAKHLKSGLPNNK